MTIDTINKMILTLKAVRAIYDATPTHDGWSIPSRASAQRQAAWAALDGVTRCIWRETVWTVRSRIDMSDEEFIGMSGEELEATDRLANLPDITRWLGEGTFLSVYEEAQANGVLPHYLKALVDGIDARASRSTADRVAAARAGEDIE